MGDIFIEYQHLFWWMAAGSVIMLIAGLLIVPWIVVRLPATYFAHRHRNERVVGRRHPVVGAVVLVFKNAVGLVLVLAGIAMLVLPGQGILTILIGLTLLNFPGKYRLERWIVTRPAVLGPINWLRRRRGRQPLEF